MANDIILKVSLDGAQEELNQLTKLQQEIDRLAKQKKALNQSQKDLTAEVKKGTKTQEEANKITKEITAQQIENGAALKANKAIYREQERQIINNTKAQQLNKGSLVQLRAQLSKDTFEYDRLTKAGRENTKQGVELKKSIDNQVNSLKQLESETGRNQRNVGNYAGSLKGLKEELNKNIQKFQALSQAERQNDKIGGKLNQTINKQRTEINNINKTLNKTTNTTNIYKKSFGSLRGLMVKGLGALGITAGLAGLVRVMSGAVRIAKDFEQGNANLAAVLGKSRAEITKLTEDAKRLGAQTAFTASEVSKLQTEFAKLGFNEKEILDATESTLNLAAATGSELGEAAAIAGATLGAFGLDASETGRVTDVMAKSFSTSALDIEKFRESMKSAAPAAAAVGVSIEETTALLGTLANAGISGSNAGTALRKTFIELNAAGLTLDEALGQVQNSEDKLGVATDLVGKKAASAFLVLAEGTETTKELKEGLNDAGGAAQKMADEQLDTLEGKTKILNSAWEGLVLSLLSGDSAFSKVSKSVITVLTELISLASGAAKAREELSDTGKKVRDVANNIIRFGKIVAAIAFGFAAYKTTLIATRIATTAYTAATRIAGFTTALFSKGIKGASTSFKGLNTVMKANPIGLVVSLLTTAASALFLFKDNADDAAKSTKNLGEEIEAAEKKSQSLDDRFAARASLSKKQLESLKSDIQEEIDLEQEKNAEIIGENERARGVILSQVKKLNQQIASELSERDRFSATFSEDDIKESDRFLDQLRDKVKSYQKQLKGLVVENGNVSEGQERILQINELLTKSINKEAKATGSLIDEQKELRKIAEGLPETTEAEITAKNRKIQSIDKEIARLKNLGTESENAAEKQKKAEEKAAKEKLKQDNEVIDNKIKTLQLERQLELATIDETNDQKLQKEKELLDKVGALRIEKAKLNNENLSTVELENQIAQAELVKEQQDGIDEKEVEDFKEKEDFKSEIRSQKEDLAVQGGKALLEAASARAEREKQIELSNLNAQLENGLISQEQFEKKRLDIERKAFESKKKRDLAVIAIDLAKEISSISAAAAANPANALTFGAAGLSQAAILTGIAVARSAVQAGIVASQKFASGGVINGASHAQGGVNVAVGGSGMIEAEGGEAIINKRSTAKHLPLLSAINEDGGGVPLAKYGALMPSASTLSKFGNGGVATQAAASGQTIDLEGLETRIADAIGTIKVQNVASETTGVANRVQQIEDSASF